MKSLNLKVLVFVLLSLITLGCSNNSKIARYLSSDSTEGVDRMQHLLAVDRLHYYLVELSSFKDGKVDASIMEAFAKLTPERIISMNLPLDQINDPMKYDALILDLVKKVSPDASVKMDDVSWGYNFLKRKLAASFKIDVYDEPEAVSGPKVGLSEKTRAELEPKVLDVEAQTLEAEHYISNRTTRGIFWEGLDSERTFEFHLSDPREFKQNVAFRGGEIIGEVKTISSNYNKIFLVKYPDEDTFRVSITNVGGVDRLEHLIHSLSLSKSGVQAVNNKIEVFGDIESFHSTMQKRLETILGHLPKADRVIIGQKAAFENHFYTVWKLQALKNLYESDPDLFTEKVKAGDQAKLKALIDDMSDFDMQKDKKAINEAFASLKTVFEKERPQLLPERFKQFEFDNFVASMSDIEFINSKGEKVRWRLLSNVWGDEIYPFARALVNTGHKKLIYSGTAGALPGRGLSVGDMVTPSQINLGDEGTSKISGANLDFDGIKRGATLGHVGSPFDETHQWLKDSLEKEIDLVEVEGRYLAQVYKPEDMGLYLMVSDVINSEGETLAQASSSKRKANLQKFIGQVLEQDSALDIKAPSQLNDDFIEQVRDVVLKALKGKGDVFSYSVMSGFIKEQRVPTEQEVLDVAASKKAFSDNFFHKKMSESSNVLAKIYAQLEEKPDMAIPRSFLEGDYNPNSDKLVVNLVALSDESLEVYEKLISEFQDDIDEVSDFFEVNAIRGPPASGSGLIQVGAPKQYDTDLMFRLFSHFGLKRSGLDYQVTNSANVTFKFLPTNVVSDVCDIAAKDFCYASYFSPSQLVRNLGNKLKNLFGGSNYLNFMDKEIDRMNKAMANNREAWKAKIEKVTVPELPNGSLARIVPDISDTDGLIIRLEITEEGLARPGVVLEELGHLKQITDSGFYKSPLYWASVTLDAVKGSARAKSVLAAGEKDVIQIMQALGQQLGVNDSDFNSYLNARASDADQLVNTIEAEVRKENRVRNKMGKSWKEMQKKLQDENLKLDDYIAKNDRVKVRSLIETFMPWEQMEPTEVNAWRRWIAAIGKPMSEVPDSEKMVMFRGLADDLVRDADNGGHFLMSTMLTKNQGNYTRRLRSLKTYRDKLAKVAGGFPYEETSIVNSLKGHSNNPVGSPFLSVSHSHTAHNFSGSQRNMAAIYTTRDRLVDNIISSYSEYERLMPLIVFPDEILDVSENVSNATEYEKMIEGKIGRSLVSGVEKDMSGGKVNKLDATLQFWDYMNAKPGLYVPETGSCADMLNKIFLYQ